MSESRPFEPGFNPRSHPNHRERGRVKYHYTVDDIAKVLNRSVNTVKKLMSNGKLFPDNLQSIINNYNQRHDG